MPARKGGGERGGGWDNGGMVGGGLEEEMLGCLLRHNSVRSALLLALPVFSRIYRKFCHTAL